MTRHRTLHIGYERLIGTALVDTALRNHLLRDPRAAAVAFGLEQDDADIATDIAANDLASFAAALSTRIYGHTPAVPARHVAVG